MPNTYQLINEIQAIFIKADPSQEDAVRPSAMIAAVIRWSRNISTPAQMKKINSRASRAGTLEISIPKIQRQYRRDQPPLKLRRGKYKEHAIPEMSPEKPSRSPLTPDEKRLITKTLKNEYTRKELETLSGGQIKEAIQAVLKRDVSLGELKRYINSIEDKLYPPELTSIEKDVIKEFVSKKYTADDLEMLTGPIGRGHIQKKLGRIVGRKDVKLYINSISKNLSSRLTSEEKDIITSTLLKEYTREEWDILTGRQIKEIIQNKLGRSIAYEDLRLHISSAFGSEDTPALLTPEEKEAVQEIIVNIYAGVDLESLPRADIVNTIQDNLKTPVLYDALRSYLSDVIEKGLPHSGAPVEKKKSPLPDKPEELEEGVPDKLVIEKAGAGFIVRGKPLTKYRSLLLSAGGSYPKKLVGGTIKEDRSVMNFKGKRLADIGDDLRGMGGVHPYKGSGKKRIRNKNIIQFKGRALEKNRERLEDEYHGKYPRKKSGSESVIDRSRIKFTGWSNIDKVKSLIFKSLSETDKYTELYRKWVYGKISDFIDTAIQASRLVTTTVIDKKIIDIVVQKIYGCSSVSKKSLEKLLESNYDDVIDDILSSRAEYNHYTLTDPAKKSLTRYINHLGWMLTNPIVVESQGELPTYTMLETRLKEIGEWVDRAGACPVIGTFTTHEVCVLRAMRHISVCYKNYFDEPIGNRLFIEAFLTLIPPGWRAGAEQYISEIIHSCKGEKTNVVIHGRLRDNDIKYSITEISSVLAIYDRESSETLFPKGEEDTEYMIIYAAALNYLSPDLSKPNRPNKLATLRRIKVLGASPKSEVVIRSVPIRGTEKEKETVESDVQIEDARDLAVRFLKILHPLNLSNDDYSEAVHIMESFPPSELKRLESLEIPKRRKLIKKILKSRIK